MRENDIRVNTHEIIGVFVAFATLPRAGVACIVRDPDAKGSPRPIQLRGAAVRTPYTERIMAERKTTNGPSDDDISEFIRTYRTQRRATDEANGVLRSIVKRAKSAGVNTKEMIAAVMATKLDPEVVAADMRDRIRYLALVRMPITQVDLFEGLVLNDVTSKTAAEDDVWTAQEAGYRAGRHGVRVDESPYMPGTEAFVEWQSWWLKGQTAIAKELGDNAEQADAGRARPKRTQEAMVDLGEAETEAQAKPRKAKKAAAGRKAATRTPKPARRRPHLRAVPDMGDTAGNA